MPTSVEPVFVDTNVLVFAKLSTSPFHAPAVRALQAQAGAELWVSRQVLREYLSAMTRPGLLTPPVPLAHLSADVRDFARRFRVADDTAAVTERLLQLVSSIAVGGKQIHDTNVVATMQAYGVTRLLTHNVADFARYASLITLLPIADF